MASDVPGTASHTPISRRTLITGVGLAAGAAVIAPRLARAQGGPMAPPSTVTTPPRDFGPNGAPTTYFTDPDVLSVDPMFNGLRPAQQRHPAALDRRPLVGGAGVERPGALPRLERHPQQPAAPLAGGQRPRERLPPAVEQQQRQHVRLPGPPALLRAPHAPGRPLRARRLDHGARGLVRGQAPQLAERRRPPPGRELLVHRSAVRRAALRGGARRRGRAEQPERPAQEPARPGRGDRRGEAGAADQLLPDRSERAGRPRRHRGPGPRPERALLLPRLQEALRRQHRQGARATPGPAARATSTSSTSGATTSSPTRSSSRTAWSTA